MSFFQVEIIIIVLVRSFRFTKIHMLWVYGYVEFVPALKGLKQRWVYHVYFEATSH